MRNVHAAVFGILVLPAGIATAGCATAGPAPGRAVAGGVAPAVCGYAVDAERAALRVRGVFAGLRGEVAKRTAAPGTTDGFIFEHPSHAVQVQVPADEAGGERAGWTATLTPTTDVRLVRVGARMCVFTRTTVEGPESLASIREDVHDGVATPMLARLEHEMRTGW